MPNQMKNTICLKCRDLGIHLDFNDKTYTQQMEHIQKHTLEEEQGKAQKRLGDF